MPKQSATTVGGRRVHGDQEARDEAEHEQVLHELRVRPEDGEHPAHVVVARDRLRTRAPHERDREEDVDDEREERRGAERKVGVAHGVLVLGREGRAHSTPQADQHMSHSQTSASWRPPHGRPGLFRLFWRLSVSNDSADERVDHHHEERDHQQCAGDVSERDADACPEDVEEPHGEDQADGDGSGKTELGQPEDGEVPVAGEVAAAGLAGEPGALDDRADEEPVDREDHGPADPVAEGRDRADERRVLPPGLVRVEREPSGLRREHRRELGVDRVDEHGDDRGDSPQERGAPAAEIPDRVPERAEQEPGVRQRDDEAVVPAKGLQELAFLDYCNRHSRTSVSLSGSLRHRAAART